MNRQTDDIFSYIWVSLSEPRTMETVAVVLAQRTTVKIGLEYTTEVWCGGSCTNRYDKLTITFVQGLCNVKMFDTTYWHSILGWYNQPCHEQ